MSMDDHKLKPCPFCGRDDRLKVDAFEQWNVCCEFCGAIGPIADTSDDACEAWNDAYKSWNDQECGRW